MSSGNARTFIKSAMSDKTLRAAVNAASSSDELDIILKHHKIPFTYAEFDDAYHNLLTECQFEEQAEELKEFKMWWDLTMSMVQS